MPYVPKNDRPAIDVAVEKLANQVADCIKGNETLLDAYYSAFRYTAESLLWLLTRPRSTVNQETPHGYLAVAIRDAGATHGYEGAFLGELNYAITRLIQRVPQIKVARNEWQDTDELRYWLYARTVEALTKTAAHAQEWNTGISGVFEDIKDEYKWRVNRPYETAQIRKSGDCCDAPYYNKPAEVVDEDGNHIGHVYVDLQRSKDTLGIDLLEYQFVARKRPSAGKK